MEINKAYISAHNTYAGKNSPKYIVVHETDNWHSGANALAHAKAQAAGNLDTSVHYYCGSDGVYQAAKHQDGTYSIGKEYGGNHAVKDANNRNTIHLEICVNPDGDYTKARANAITLVKHLMEITKIPAERVIRHFDAKGKYCPRNMLDNPVLWMDFKAQLGQPAQQETTPSINTQSEIWYRVGNDWKNGICQNQTGAYHNKGLAIIDCGPGQNVYDNKGRIIHSVTPEEVPHSPETTEKNYTLAQFILEVQTALGAEPDGIAGGETLQKTVTVSRSKNKYHTVVTPLERRLKQLGYYQGEIEMDHNESPCFGRGMADAVEEYQKKVLGYANTDGEITAGKKMWKSLLDIL